MKLSPFLLLLLFCTQVLQAQENKAIQRSNRIYSETQSDIKDCKILDFEDPLYCNKIVKNKYNNATLAQTKIALWYWDAPYIYEDEDEDEVDSTLPKDCLTLVTENKQVGKKEYHTELLYDKGKLIFAYHKVKINTTNYELKLYFENEKIIKKIGKTNKNTYTEKQIIQLSKKYLKRFLSSFGMPTTGI